MSLREEQCKKVCRILDDVLANRPTERDSLIVAVRKAFESLEQFGNSEPLPPAQPERIKGRWISADAIFGGEPFYCSECGENTRDTVMGKPRWNFCPNCGADMREVTT